MSTESVGTLKILGLMAIAFGAGFTFSQFVSKDSIFASSGPSECVAEVWQNAAREADWTPKNQCPAYPMRLAITSPGDQTLIEPQANEPKAMQESLVVAFSRPFPEGLSLYVAAQDSASGNLYVSKQVVSENASRTAVHSIGRTELGIDLSRTQKMRLWAVLAEDDARLGDVYSSIQQLQESTPNVYVSPPVNLNVGGKDSADTATTSPPQR